MSVMLDQVAPWGRSLEEYRKMFMLSNEELNWQILGVGDGPASFNSEMYALGYTVVSIDPIYLLSEKQIEQRIEKTYDTVISQVKQKPDNFVWDFFENPTHLGCYRLDTMRRGAIFRCHYRNSVLPISNLIWQSVRIFSSCIQISCQSIFTENPLKNFAAYRGRYGFSRF